MIMMLFDEPLTRTPSFAFTHWKKKGTNWYLDSEQILWLLSTQLMGEGNSATF
jgi:hypothetical protein